MGIDHVQPPSDPPIEPAGTSLVERAREAAARGDWPSAYDLLTQADASAPLGASDLGVLAEAAYATGRPNETIGAWERAHTLSLRTGDRLGAAAAGVRVAFHLLIDTGLMAPVRGWIARVERLLEGHEETPVHAWRAVVHSYERLLSGDLAAAATWARRAVEVGSRAEPAAAAIGRVAEARSIILSGEVRQGVALLNEAAVAAVTGELDAISTGVVYCEVVCALQGIAQYDLAEEWTSAMEGWHRDKPVGSIHGRCRVHRAEILRLRGSCADAEREAIAACEELRPYLRRELGWPLTELGRIRFRMGDLDGAEEAFRQAWEVGWDPQPGLALVQMARGDVGAAARSIRDAVAHPPSVPSKELPPNTELRLAPLLEAQVEIELAAGELDLARAAADRLTSIAVTFESTALAAGAALASGRVRLAAGDALGALHDLERAVTLWGEVGAPYETAVARAELSRAYGDPNGGKHATTGGEGGADRSAAVNVFRREGDFWSVDFAGRAAVLRDLKGMHYLARLLGAPGREIHVLDLVAAECGPSGIDRDGEPEAYRGRDSRGDVFLDPQAKEAYRKRLAEVDEDIEEAHSIGDAERATQANAERDFLIRELSRAVGMGGRDRRWGSASERARASVTRAVRQAMARIREHHPALDEHLTRTIRTGTFCAYLPDSRIPSSWTF